MLGFATFAALLPQLRDAWSLTNVQAGTLGGMFFVGYVASVSLWTALTDRGDGRKIYAAGSIAAVAGSAGFALFARGFVSAICFQALLGIGIGGTYMPGLRLLSDRIAGPKQSRAIAFYTASFGVGTALSLALAGEVAGRLSWRAAFLVAAAGPLIAGTLHSRQRSCHPPGPPPLDSLRDGVVGVRRNPARVLGTVALGNRVDAARSVFDAGHGRLGHAHGGLVAAAPPELRGSAMGVYSLAGFGGGMLGPIVFGAALDAAGGALRPLSWVVGYASIGVGCLAAPLIARWFGGGGIAVQNVRANL